MPDAMAQLEENLNARDRRMRTSAVADSSILVKKPVGAGGRPRQTAVFGSALDCSLPGVKFDQTADWV
jgi:hypothetical protein